MSLALALVLTIYIACNELETVCINAFTNTRIHPPLLTVLELALLSTN